MPDDERTSQSKLDQIMRRRKRATTRNVLILVLLIVVIGLFFWTRGKPQQDSNRIAAPPTTEVAPAPPPAPAPPVRRPIAAPEPPKPEPPAVARPTPPKPRPPSLPSLDESDPLVRERVEPLSNRLQLSAWLENASLVRRFVVSVANIAEGSSPQKHLPELRPSDPFTVFEHEGRIHIDPASYDRYDIITQVFTSLDERSSASVITFLSPLLDQAYRELGYSKGDFEELLARGINELLGAPVVTGEVEVALKVVTYEYLDPELEDLSGAQKQLLRAGPINVARIQGKLRKLAFALGIPEQELSRPSFHEAQTPEDETQ